MVDLYFIEGKYNSGKSTLVRCLTGTGQTYHSHPDTRNVVKLDWNGVPRQTLVLDSSLNEGNLKTQRKKLTLPDDLEKLIDKYENDLQVEAAILTVNSSIGIRCYNASAYAALIQNNQICPHPILGVVTLGTAHGVIAQVLLSPYPARLFLPPAQAQPPVSRNLIAAQIRPSWGLT